LAAHAIGDRRLTEIIERYSLAEALDHAEALIDYAKVLTETAVSHIPDGSYTFTDHLDDDGQPNSPRIPIKATITIKGSALHIDFSGTATAVRGNLNAVPAITKSAVAYCLRCVALALVKTDLPMNEGAFTPISLTIEPGSLLDPHPPHAVAAGNVETSQRITDVVFGALAQALPHIIPAASQGTMNNLTFGGNYPESDQLAPAKCLSPRKRGAVGPFAYYETMGGGAGAGPHAHGGSGLHTHMSNTLNTPVEALEYSYPLRVEQYSLRKNSGGDGLYKGGDGLVRAIRFLSPVTVTLTSERRKQGAYGLQGGEDGKPGRNSLIQGGNITQLPGKFTRDLANGDVLKIETPGGGGWGENK